MADLTVSANVDTLMQSASFAAFRTSLSLVIGTNVQAWDADLDTWATITPGTGVGTMLATFSSANIKSACTDETGSGSLVFATSPTFTTPSLGVASATSVNGLVITSTSSTLTLPPSITLTGPAASGTVMTLGNAETVTGVKTFSAINAFSGSTIRTVNAMGALAIDVTKGVNTKTIATGQTFTFSGTPATAATWFSVKITNSSGGAVTATIPSSFSVSQNTTITTVSVPASGVVFLTWEYDGSAYNLYGDPPTTSGSGSFALTTSPAITTATLAGANVLLEGGSVQLDPAGSADGAYSGITMTGTSGYTQAFGDLVMLDPNQSPARWELASVSAAAGAVGDCRGGLAIVVVTATDGNTCTLLRFGVVRADANFPTFTVNGAVYATTTGDVTNTQPSTTDHVIRIVGNALTTDEIFFDPDKNWITHT